MPTAGELKIILEAQDNASRQLQQVAQQVAGLERATERAQQSAGGLSRVFSGIGSGLRAGLGFAAAEVGLQGIHQVAGLVVDSVVGMNSRLEDATATFRTFTGSASEARAIVEELNRNADITPFDTREVIKAGQDLISSAQGSKDALMELLRTAEQLAAYRPTEGLSGATFALREALEGDLTSIRERFGLSAQAIRNWQATGMTALQAVQAEMQRVGATSRLVQELSQTFGGLSSNITSAFAEVQRRLGAGLFDRLEDGLKVLNNALDQNRAAIYEWATRVGAIIGEVSARIGGILGNLAVQLANWIDPGMGDRLKALFSGVSTTVQEVEQQAEQATPQVQALDRALSLPQAREALAAARSNMQGLQTLSASTARPVEQLARDLGSAGLAAAELQFNADRVRDAYQRQLEPLERQLRTLQQSAEAQRIQNALASNQGAVQRLRLEREIAALQGAAGGAVDPQQEGLTLRQRLIAYALQERQLQLQALGIEEERRPVIQQLQERIEQLNEAQRRALEPVQAQIAAQKERIDLLQLERQRWEVLRGEIQGAVDAINSANFQPRPKEPDTAEVDQVKAELERIGKEFGERFQKGWDDWWAAGGGTVWGAVTKSIETWYAGGGKVTINRIGSDIGKALGDAAAGAFETAMAGRLETIDRILTFLNAVESRLAGRDREERLRDIRTEAGREALRRQPRVSPAGGEPGTLLGGAGEGVTLTTLPRVVEAAAVPPAPPAAPVVPVVVNVSGVDVQVGDAATREDVIDQLTETLGRDVAMAVVQSLEAAEAWTDPGPNTLVQGMGRGRTP
jgi:hypothetical protein